MVARNEQHEWPFYLRLLAGVETGVLGGVAMLAWFFLSSTLLHHSIWIVPNLLGGVLHQEAVLRRGFSLVTVSGLSLHLFAAGTVGIVFAVLAGGIRSRRRIMLLGVIAGLVWFYFSNALVWRKLGALAWVYSSPRMLLVGHLIFGVVLGSYPLLRGLSGGPGTMPPAGAGPGGLPAGPTPPDFG